jgi:hypothetical protein
VSGSGLLQLPGPPADWVKMQPAGLRLELYDGGRTAWQVAGPPQQVLPQRVLLTLQNRRCLLTATLLDGTVHLDLREDPGVTPVAATGSTPTPP